MRLRPIALFVLIGLSAAACTSGSGQSSDTPSPSPSSVATSIHSAPTSSAPVTTSSSSTVPTTGPNVRPGEKPPTLSRIAGENTSEGAVNFTMFWIETLDWGYATTDSTLARQNFLPSCTDCTRFMKNFDGPRSAGDHFRGGRVSIHRAVLTTGRNEHPDTTPVDITFDVGRLQTISPSGHVITTAPAIARLTYRTWVKWLAGHWHVAYEKQVEFK